MPGDHLIFRFDRSAISCLILLFFFAGAGRSQTYQVGSGAAAQQGKQTNGAQAPDQQLGWGSSIGNARLARAAELALQKGDHALALDYAQRAAHGAPNDPQIWFLVGYAARLAGRYGQSADAYHRGLQLKPSSVDGLSGLAQTYGLMGHTDEAVRMLKSILASNPGRQNDLVVLGNLYVRTGDYTDAIDTLTKAEHMKPAAQTELLLAVSYEHLKQMDKASHYLDLAKSRAPNNPDIERSLAQFYRQTGDFPKAIEALKTIRNPQPVVVAELAYTYGLDGKLEDAARLYARAADALPRDLGLQLSAAQAQVAISEIDHAAPFLQRASKINPNYYRLHAIKGEIAQIQEQNEEAAKEYSAAVANLPASPVEGVLYGIQLHMNLESLYRNLDETVLSQQQLGIAENEIAPLDERGPDRVAFLRLRALIKMDGNHLDSAMSDMTEALAINPQDANSLQLDGDLLMKMNRVPDALVAYKKALAIDPKSRVTLTSLGYASRTAGDDVAAEKYFNLLAKDYPNSYVPYLALGDLYSARGKYKIAETEYAHGYKLAPRNAMIVAGGMNAGIEGHDLPLAATWLHRVDEKMAMVPQILEEKERYFSFTGDLKQSAEYGREAIKVLPNTRDVVVYLGYDLLHLGQYAELKALTDKYENVFAKEPDIPLLAGYVYKHDDQPDEAVKAFTEALKRDPNVVTAYTNRGYVYNDLRKPELAAADFEQALKREPNNAEAHLGLAFADLSLNHLRDSIHQTELEEAELGDSEVVHTIRATAYGREGRLTKAEAEYRAALKFDPTDGTLYMGLGNIAFAERRFKDSVAQLETAAKCLPENPSVYALMARANASLKDRDASLRDIRLAEDYAQRQQKPLRKTGPKPVSLSDIYVSTGEAFSTLGDQPAAMNRFTRALRVPESDRVSVRLAIAALMAQQGHTSGANRQIALAQMEAEAGDTAPPTGSEYIQIASILQQLHEFELSETYLQRARAAGAPDTTVRITLANSYLALGETRLAAAELAAVNRTDDDELDYQFLLAQADLYQQEHLGTEALSAFAQASTDAGEDRTAETQLLSAGANEGYRVNTHLSYLTNVTVQPIFDDSTVYVLDSKLDSPTPVPSNDTAQLPLPRSQLQTSWINAFHLHFNGLPTNSAFYELRNARGVISVPYDLQRPIVHRDTTDSIFNFSLDPSIHIGENLITLASGVQETIRRDSLNPVQLNENLFRVFTYFTTTSFLRAVSADGYFTYEFGPFTEEPLSAKNFIGALNFRVGAPWDKTALITGWGINDQKFESRSSLIGNSEDYYTSSYIGLSRRFSTHFNAEAIMEDTRAWRVDPANYSVLHSAIAQSIRPAATIDYSPNQYWDIQGTGSYESTRSFHVYDMTQTGFSVSYTRPIGRIFNNTNGKEHLKYPLRISAGMQQETFFNFTPSKSEQFRPYASITLF